MMPEYHPSPAVMPPHAPQWRVFRSAVGAHVLAVPHSRLYDLASSQAAALERNEPGAIAALEQALLDPEAEDDMARVPAVPPQAISLNVSASCNLTCGYCYATRGSFAGRQSTQMKWETAKAAVDQLLSVSDTNAPMTIGFLGGEPFVNRRLVHRVVRYASRHAERRARDVRFSVTTNGTLLTPADVELMQQHRFAVTVSVDGGRAITDRQRPTVNGESTFDLLRAAVTPLLVAPGRAQVAARVTVTRDCLSLRQRFDDLVALGFRDVGFSPVRVGGAAQAALSDSDWPVYLAALVEVAASELRGALCGSPIRLTNLAVALKQLHRGASMPYACGAGGGYFSVAASGEWYACHRAIGEDAYRLGTNAGIETDRQRAFLTERHVHAQPACQECWARYLCSGGCHQEAAMRSQSACGFIRAWLDFCLRSYCELSHSKPEWFAARRPS